MENLNEFGKKCLHIYLAHQNKGSITTKVAFIFISHCFDDRLVSTKSTTKNPKLNKEYWPIKEKHNGNY